MSISFTMTLFCSTLLSLLLSLTFAFGSLDFFHKEQLELLSDPWTEASPQTPRTVWTPVKTKTDGGWGWGEEVFAPGPTVFGEPFEDERAFPVFLDD